MGQNVRRGSQYLSDPGRLKALGRLKIVGSAPEEAFDTITRITRTLFGVEIATIHLVGAQTQWVKSSSDGVRIEDTPLGHSICEYTVSEGDLVFVPDLTRDSRFANTQWVTGPDAVRFYAGMPLTTREGHHVGALCLLDSRAGVRADFSDHELAVFRQLANLTVNTMELRAAHDEAQGNFLRAMEEDELTGLMSHRGILLRIKQLLDESRSTQAVFMIKIRLQGIDDIKHGYGGTVLGQLLQTLAARLQKVVKAGNLLARIDDQSFLLARVFSRHSEQCDVSRVESWAQQTAELALETLDSPVETDAELFFLRGAAGIAGSANGEIDPYRVLEQAREAAKSAEKHVNTATGHLIEWARSDKGPAHRDRLSLEKRLRRAVAHRELSVVYQPIVDLENNGQIAGAEALVRWPQSEGPAVGPDVFIPLAEDLGLIGDLGLWVFGQACVALRQWNAETGRNLWMSVNFSPLQLRDHTLPGRLKEISREADVAPSQIKLEITESALVTRFDEVNALLEWVVREGFSLALDDFGTGHSSLTRLIHLPFNVLKVDRAFVCDSPDGPGAAVVASLSGLARTLKLETVGEGVETEAQAEFLRSQGYGLAQGYLYSRPLSGAAFLEQLKASGETSVTPP